MGDDDRLVETAEMFAGIARELAALRDPQPVLEHIVSLAVEHLRGCELAGITLNHRGRISSPAASDPIPLIVDRIQEEVDEGPCIDAIREHAVFQTDDLTAEARWPRFSTRAHAETGITSVLAFRLFADEETMGALNLYSTRVAAFDDTDLALGSVFAAHAGVALSAARREENLERKAATREVIGQAKGVLMAHRHITDHEAFDVLRCASQRLNMKLVDVAEEVTITGEPPAHPARP